MLNKDSDEPKYRFDVKAKEIIGNATVAWAGLVVVLIGIVFYFAVVKNAEIRSLRSELVEIESAIRLSDSRKISTQLESGLTSAQVRADERRGAPVSLFPATFSSQERSKITETHANPQIDYYELVEERDVASFAVEKYSQEQLQNQDDFRFEATIIFSDGSNAGYVFGENQTIEPWAPECIDMGCPELPEEFVEKHPDIASLIQNQ